MYYLKQKTRKTEWVEFIKFYWRSSLLTRFKVKDLNLGPENENLSAFLIFM